MVFSRGEIVGSNDVSLILYNVLIRIENFYFKFEAISAHLKKLFLSKINGKCDF